MILYVCLFFVAQMLLFCFVFAALVPRLGRPTKELFSSCFCKQTFFLRSLFIKIHTMHGKRRDTAPDEDRLNCIAPPNKVSNGLGSLSSHVLEEDTAHYLSHHAESFRNETGHRVQSRSRHHVHEPVDTTPDSVGSIERRVFPASPQRRQTSNAAAYYKSEENRLTTFSAWQHQRVVRKEDLARNGFVYTGTADKVGFVIKVCMVQCTLLHVMFVVIDI